MPHDSQPRPDPARSAQPTTRLDSAQLRATGLVGGRYELGELIGEGGAAHVYHARDKVLDRVVAVKLLREEYGADEEFIARFYREARAVASLSTPNIVDIYDYGAHDKTYFIAMQYIEGTDLKSILRRTGRLDPARVVALADDILRGLGAAHERGIVHRDVKPQNLLVRASDGHVKLTDFGVARTLDAAQNTAVGTMVGTAHYMAPEQASGGVLGPASDLYGVGVVLFEALTGKLPYDGTAALQIALQHMRDPVPSLNAIAPEVPPALARVVERALAKDPARRYPNAEAMRLALHEALPGVPPRVNGTFPLDAASTNRTQVLPPGAVANGAATVPANRRPVAHASRPAARFAGSGCILPLLGLLIVALLVAVVVLARSLTAPGRATATIAAGIAPSPTTAAALIPVTPTLAPPTITQVIPASTVAPPTNTVAPPTAAVPIVVPPTPTVPPPPATSVPPTATAIPPTATATKAPSPPTATAVPPTPTPTPRGQGSGGNGNGNDNLQVDNFKPDQLQGAYRRDDGKLYGLPEVALYGEGTGYNQGTVNFRANNVPDGTLTLTLIGLDDERNDRCRLQVILNGTTVFDGANTFPNTSQGDNGEGGKERYWDKMTIRVPAGTLRNGTNTLILRNRTPGPNIGIPYILINDVSFAREQ